MAVTYVPQITKRYDLITDEKASGATYTPPELADFVAAEIVRAWDGRKETTLRVLDPAVGEGELLASLLKRLPQNKTVEVHGFDNDRRALAAATARLQNAHPKASLNLAFGDFLSVVCGNAVYGSLFEPKTAETFDLVIANPPYVRTQIMGASAARALADQFGLTGRVDLYHAFILAIAKVLRPHGVAGIIVSNRFMTTKAGATVRRAFQDRLHLRHVWDLGDTKLFNAAVLPAVLVAEGLNGTTRSGPTFTSIYQTKDEPSKTAPSITAALSEHGIVAVPDGRRFRVQRGSLDTSNESAGVWRVANLENDAWLATVERHTAASFRDLGKVRVGVKTCADRVFIRSDWDALPEEERPELLHQLTTHHVARRFRADAAGETRRIVYPHEYVEGKRRTVNLADYPKTRRYLQKHRAELEARSYVIEAGRHWFELWVPQDPGAWSRPKIVFRDISEEPCFWIDKEETIVNGDCYWLACDDPAREDLLWLAASVGNSTFIEAFYDHRFNNKLYAGRRRFITQYVEKFPLPDPYSSIALSIIAKAKMVYETHGTVQSKTLQKEINSLVWQAFGLSLKEVRR
ncbi:MAG: N-6 DNA methylase [Phycisphaeraceae bacterium]|nr:N-6 DNA methylase [Phycisphaeraceae bacterium]